MEVPLLVLQSTSMNAARKRVSLSPSVSAPWFDLVRRHVPAARIEIVSVVGHFPMLEAADAVNQGIAVFVADVS